MLKKNSSILITGVAGFIGFSLAEDMLNKGHKVYGIDNFDKYYSLTLKKKRLEILKKQPSFYFKNIDIVKNKELKAYLSKKKFDYIFNFAAQPGVRYSLINPQKYVDVNIIGFINLLESIKNKKIKKFFYASSSSVYGDTNKFPVDEKQKLNPKNPYGISKRINEELAAIYSLKNKAQFIGLRFFTIYGEYGRPDMFLFKMFKSSKTRKNFYLNNHGNHERDFTYVKDVALILEKLITKKLNKNSIFNVCSNNPQSILKITNLFQKKNNLKVKQIEKHKADILKTHGDNTKIKKITGFNNFSKFRDNIFKLYEWYKQNKIDKL